MPVLKGKELRIVGFLCNWCSYGGADTAGVARATQPTDLRIIRVPCSGRVDPLFIIKALFENADGVLVSGCHPRDCHYSVGNYYARRRLEIIKEFLPILGIDSRRFEYTWVSASEGQLWQKVVTDFTNQIHELGPMPKIEDATPFLRLADMALSPLHALGTNRNAPLDELKEAIKARLPELDCVIGWGLGYDQAHATPIFMKTPEDVDKLIWGPLNTMNCATYLPLFKGKKVGVVVKGCDSRSVIELLQEKLINRDEVVIFSIPCEGTLDMGRINAELGRYTKIDEVRYDDASVTIVADGKEHRFCMTEYAQGKCYTCVTPGAVIADTRFGVPVPVTPGDPTPPELALLDKMTLDERRAYWKGQMERCIRCYACRNACPMCVCRDFCISDSRGPHWMSQGSSAKDKLFFQTIHAVHLAGRCTLCGECQRACPMGIPILSLRQQIARAIRSLFDNYKSGMNLEAVPPLMTYLPEEKNIHAKEWK
ncbi:MAG: hydrogenase iron-sulfur subunit [Desulfovibrio sp.]|nr:hydrogenase iron-sulfur subunit [Desulfovibrio sp.]